jgi:thiol:disulfide interchange protein
MKPAVAALAIVAALMGTAALLARSATAADGPSFPDVGRAQADIADAVRVAAQQKRRVLVDFGANWCSDCKILDKDLHLDENAALLRDHYVLVHVNVGDRGIDDNIDLAARYGIPLKKGVPALAVLDGEGRVVTSQKDGEFESMKRVDPASVHEFLLHWSQ